MSGFGSDAMSSLVFHGVLRSACAARMRATSPAFTSGARLPNEFRTYDAIAAIHSSELSRKPGIRSGWSPLPSMGPLSPCSSVLIT